jgi:hypothetical protein
VVCNMVIFYGEELLAPRPTLKLEGHPLSAVRDCLFNVFTATLHIRRLFLHPQHDDVPCCGDRDPLVMVNSYTDLQICQTYQNFMFVQIFVTMLFFFMIVLGSPLQFHIHTVVPF